MVLDTRSYPVMNGKRVFKHAVTRMPAAIMPSLDGTSISASAVFRRPRRRYWQ